MSSEAQKKAYRTYNQKNKKTFSAVYTPTDMKEAIRFENHLKSQTLSKNEYLKKLIKNDLDSKGIPYPDDMNIDWLYIIIGGDTLQVAYYMIIR